MADLLTEVGKFRAWAASFPGAGTWGEWECEYEGWPALYEAVHELMAGKPFESWSDVELGEVLYAIARDHEMQRLAREVRERRPELVLPLTRAAVRLGEGNARWELAEELGHLGRAGGEEERLLLDLAQDPDEYVRRLSLRALLRLGSPAVEDVALTLWHRPDENQQWARMMVLGCLHQLGSPHLDPLLAEAEQDPREYLRGYAERIRRGEPVG